MSKATLGDPKDTKRTDNPEFAAPRAPPAPAAFSRPQRGRAWPCGAAPAPRNGGASRPLPRLRARHSAGRAHGSRPLAASRPLLLEQRRLRRAPPGMAATAAPERGQRGGPGAGPAEPINSLARLSAASCSGSAEVGAGTAGRERSGVPPAPSPGVGQASAGGQRRLCARPSAGAAPRRVTASLPLGPGPVRKGASAGSGRCPAQLTRSSPGALVEVMTLSPSERQC